MVITLDKVDIQSKIRNPLLIEAKRREIAKASYQVFTKKGFRNSTVDEIASLMNIDKRNLYNYIGKKEDLLYLVFCHFLPFFHQQILTAIRNISDPMGKLRIAILENLNLTNEYQDFFMLVTRELRYLPPDLIQHVLNMLRELFGIYESILEEGVALHQFNIKNSRIAAFSIIAMIHMRATSRWELKKYSLEEIAEQINAIIFGGLLNKNQVL